VPDPLNTGPTVGPNVTGTWEENHTEELVDEILAVTGTTAHALAAGVIDVETTELVDFEGAFATPRIEHGPSLLNLGLNRGREHINEDLRAILVRHRLLGVSKTSDRGDREGADDGE
jgi:hypothetical protein